MKNMTNTLIYRFLSGRNCTFNKTWRFLIRPTQSYTQRKLFYSAVRKTSEVSVRPVFCGRTPVQTWLLLHRNKLPTQVLSCCNKRWFHVSPRRQALPLLSPIIMWLVRLGAILTGRSLRKWLKAQPKEVRRKYYKLLALKLAILFSGFGAFLSYNYYKHEQEAPITHRKRYISLTPEQYLKIAEVESQELQEIDKDNVYPSTHPYYDLVLKVARRLVSANQDIPGMAGQNWHIFVIKSGERNARVLPNGDIFVYSGLIEFMDNEDQLAMVIGHEMAHAIMLHAAEMLSYVGLLDYLIVLIMAAMWTVMPTDGIAVVTQWFFNKVMQLSVHRPYSRKLEKEADVVGLHLASKACYDVREGSVFWSKMDITSDIRADKIPEWISTHPSHENRVELFDFLLPAALELRKESKCPALSECDPRTRIKQLRKHVDNRITANKARANLQQVQKVRPPGSFRIFTRSLVDDGDNAEIIKEVSKGENSTETLVHPDVANGSVKHVKEVSKNGDTTEGQVQPDIGDEDSARDIKDISKDRDFTKAQVQPGIGDGESAGGIKAISKDRDSTKAQVQPGVGDGDSAGGIKAVSKDGDFTKAQVQPGIGDGDSAGVYKAVSKDGDFTNAQVQPGLVDENSVGVNKDISKDGDFTNAQVQADAAT